MLLIKSDRLLVLHLRRHPKSRFIGLAAPTKRH
jgi:hypothetical protein